jgi:hypothetical protein
VRAACGNFSGPNTISATSGRQYQLRKSDIKHARYAIKTCFQSCRLPRVIGGFFLVIALSLAEVSTFTHRFLEIFQAAAEITTEIA